MADDMQEVKSRFEGAMREFGKENPKINDELIQKSSNALATMPLYCSGTITALSLVFYTRNTNELSTGAKYVGNAGGLSSPGSISAAGNLYTNDYNALINNTASFMWSGASVYFQMTYFDSNSNVLGTMQTGGLGVVGTGGGNGSW